MDVYEIRHRNLLWLMAANKAAGHKDKDFGQRVGGIGGSFLSQLKGGKPMGDEVARSIDSSLGRAKGWMDVPQWDGAPAPTIDQSDSFALALEAMAHSQTYLAQALAATIPTVAEQLVSALDNKLPADLQETKYIQVLRSAILAQLVNNDMASLRSSKQKSPAAPPRKPR